MNCSGVCTVCLEKLSKENYGCQCRKCMKSFHLKCGLIVSTLTKESAKKWVCQQCDFQSNMKSLLESQQLTINQIPELVASEVKKQLSHFEEKLSSAVNPIKSDVTILEGLVSKTRTDNLHLQSNAM